MLNNHHVLFRRFSIDASQNELRADIYQHGGDPNLVDELILLNIIKDYRRLQIAFKNLLPSMKQSMDDLRFLICLSGEKEALNYAIDHLNLDKYTHNKWQENALHHAVLSGKPKQVNEVLNKLQIAWDSESYGGLNLLHYAILSKSIPQIEYVLDLEKNNGKQLPLTIKKNRNILHLAAISGDPETLEKTLQIASERGLDIKASDVYNANALNYAISSQNLRIIQRLTDLGLIAQNQEQFSFGEMDERRNPRP